MKLNQVTPLSKYLAMALFIIMPFVAGYIGFQYGTAQASGEPNFCGNGTFIE